MRKTTLVCLIAALGFISINKIHSGHKQPYPLIESDIRREDSNPSAREEEEDGMQEAMEQEFRLTKDPALNEVPRERLIPAMHVRDQRLSAWRGSVRTMAAIPGVNWTERGPVNVGGRTRALLYDLNDAVNGYKKVWAGSVGGGLWYTNDITAATPTWTKVDDFLGNLAITTLAQDATTPQQMYAGTGEGWFNADAIQGLGIWKSFDGGATWNQIPSTNTNHFVFVQKIIAYTSGGVNYVFACTRGPNSSFGGLMRSTDGGITWGRMLASGVGGATSSRAADVERGADGALYCSMGIFQTDGIYRSTDNGANWTKIYTSVGEYRIELACAPSNANKVYAMVSDNSGNPALKKIMVTANSTAATPAWSSVTQPTWCDQGVGSTDLTRGQAWYDMIALVDPGNENIVYIGGVDLMKTTNGGTTWAQITQWASGCGGLSVIHADNHALVFRPGASTEFLAGNDGGIYRTTNSGTTFSTRNNLYNVTQYYGVAMHPSNFNYFLAGAQDNGTQKFTTGGLNTTIQAAGGDGGFPHIDQQSPNVQIAAFTGNNFALSLNGGASFSQVVSFANGSFINPTDYDDASKKLYAGYSGGSYLRWENPATGGSTGTPVTVTAFGGMAITNVTVSPLTANRVYFGLSSGAVIMVDNAHTGTSKTGVVIKPAAGGISVSSLAIDPANEDHMLVTYSNYGVVSIYESLNATQASPVWTAVEGNLPDMPVRWAIFDPRNPDMALIATELGVWSTDDLNGGLTDWQPTNSGLANVRVDMLQYRKADRTIAAATHGRGLYTTVVPNSTAPEIDFNFGTGGSVEQTAATTGCRYYKDYTVDMTIANAPVGNATVNLFIAPGNTATEGVDFDYTTNGNFGSISHTATFTSGSTTPVTVTIRVYDDAEVEPAENFTIKYSISGATDAVAGKSFQQYSFVIDNNDAAPSSYTGNFTIGTYNANTTGGVPFKSNRLKHRLQTLYTAGEMKTAGMNGMGSITAMTIRVVVKNSTQPFKNLNIYMGNTAATNLFAGYEPVSTLVYSGNFTSVVGDNVFIFSTPFQWDGVSNVVVQYCFDNEPGTADAMADVMECNAAPLGTNGFPSLYSDYTTPSATPACSLPDDFISDARINATFTASGATPVATVLNTAKSEYLAPNNDLYYYSPAGEIIARIRSLTPHDYGCSNVTIDRAGTGALPFWSLASSTFLTQKTWHVVPTTNNPAGQYQITLYFTAAEKAGWEAATGNLWNNIKVVKVKSQISNYSPATPLPDGAGTVEIVDPVFGTVGPNYTLTATFATGFSGFAAGIPGIAPLPLTLLNFTGKLDNNTALLQWSTSNEHNTHNFEIEKSTDATHYYKIGTVNAAGNSSSQKDYSYTDHQLSSENYYRLRMNDRDGRNTISPVVLIRITGARQNVWVVNNPFQTYLDLRFAKEAKQVRMQLINANGALVAEQSLTGANGQTRWNLPANLSKGSYVLRTIIDGEVFTSKLIRQ